MRETAASLRNSRLTGTPVFHVRQQQAAPAARSANYALFLLVLTSACAQLDVSIVPYLAPYIQRDFRISDTSLSLLIGVSFALFYTLVGIPIARFIDHYSRKAILLAGIVTWTIGAALCGVAQNFAQLFAARFIVGGGESVNGPTAYSLMSDLFPRERLTRAVAFYHIGQVWGPALAMMVSGLLMALLVNIKPLHMPFGKISGWQLIFIITSLPGFVIATMIGLTMYEPERRIIPNQMFLKNDASAVPSKKGFVQDYVVALRYIGLHREVFGPIFMALLIGALYFGAVNWFPIFFQRTYGWEPAKLAVLQSAISIFLVPVGMAMGVVLEEHYTRKGYEDAPVRVLIISRLLALTAIVAPLMPSPWLALACIGVTSTSLGMTGPVQSVQMQTVTPTEIRGKLTSLYMFLLNVTGIALSPILVALLTDYVFRDPMQIRWSIACLLAFSTPVGLYFIVKGRRPYIAEVRRLKELEARARGA